MTSIFSLWLSIHQLHTQDPSLLRTFFCARKKPPGDLPPFVAPVAMLVPTPLQPWPEAEA